MWKNKILLYTWFVIGLVVSASMVACVSNYSEKAENAFYQHYLQEQEISDPSKYGLPETMDEPRKNISPIKYYNAPWLHFVETGEIIYYYRDFWYENVVKYASVKADERYGAKWEAYIALKDQGGIPPLVPKPDIPKQEVLTQIYETDAEFKEIVEKAQQKLNADIKNITAEYKKTVELRNKKIAPMNVEQKKRLLKVKEERERAMEVMLKAFTRDLFPYEFYISGTGEAFIEMYLPAGEDKIKIATYKTTKLDLDERKNLNNNKDAFSYVMNFIVREQVQLSPELNLNKSKVAFSLTDKETDKSNLVVDLNAGSIEYITQDNLQDKYYSVNYIEEMGKILKNVGSVSIADFVGGVNDLTPKLIAMEGAKEDRNKFAIVIGIEEYDKYAPSIKYATNSAELFSLSLTKVLGVPAHQISKIYNTAATGGGVKSDVKAVLDRVDENSTVYLYYNGHGIPNNKEGGVGSAEPYILPVDYSSETIVDEKYFKLQAVYDKLNKSKAGKVVVVIDSCFSGSTDGQSVSKSNRAAFGLKARDISLDENGKMIVFTAGKSDQYSIGYDEKGERLFTYYFVKALMENNGDENTNQVFLKIQKDVEFESAKITGSQSEILTPQIYGNRALSVQ